MCDSDDEGGWTVKKGKTARRRERYTPAATSGSEEHAQNQQKYLQCAIAGAEIAFHTNSGSLSGEKVGCAMFYLINGEALTFVYNTSHSSKGTKSNLTALRLVSGVDKDKVTVCAEEHIIAEHPDKEFLFSAAFRNRGFVRPCSNRKGAGKGGCSLLLNSRNILDISGHL